MARNDITQPIPPDVAAWLSQLAERLDIRADRGTTKGEPSRRGLLQALVDTDISTGGKLSALIVETVKEQQG